MRPDTDGICNALAYLVMITIAFECIYSIDTRKILHHLFKVLRYAKGALSMCSQVSVRIKKRSDRQRERDFDR